MQYGGVDDELAIHLVNRTPYHKLGSRRHVAGVARWALFASDRLRHVVRGQHALDGIAETLGKTNRVVAFGQQLEVADFDKAAYRIDTR